MNLEFLKKLLVLMALTSITKAGVSPAIPADRRTEYFFIANDNLGYKYGYDTGSGIYAKQVANAENQVVGQYAYPDSNGKTVVVNYRSGADGFIPEEFETLIPNVKTSDTQATWQSEALPQKKYQFSYSTSDSSRKEGSDELGKKEGQYSFQNKDNKLDVIYSADGKMGFKLIKENTALKQVQLQDLPQIIIGGGDGDDKTNNGAYSFQYSNPESSRVESSDVNGNIKGQYSYTNNAGTHDLSYIAGPGVGFQPTGGSLAQPNAVSGAKLTSTTKQISWPTDFPTIQDLPNWQDLPQLFPGGGGGGGSGDGDDKKNNGAYSFQYSNPESSRMESSDVNGNIKGQYSYTNNAGTHDLSYIAGPGVGFQPTGGSLAQPNGLSGEKLTSSTKQISWPTDFPTIQDLPNWQDLPQLFPGGGGGGGSGDGDDKKNNGAYSFQYSNPESSRVESSDVNGNIKGQYSYTNNAGTHDLSYIAGPGVGFQPTGGSLAQPNGLKGAKLTSTTKQISWPTDFPTIQDLPNWQDLPQLFPGGGGGGGSGDGDDKNNNAAYSFQYSNPESSRMESSDVNGNIKGQYSYTNNAGTHDLSYIAGPGVGFQPTGGSLAQPNGLSGAKLTSTTKQITFPIPSFEDFPYLQDLPHLTTGGGGGDGGGNGNGGGDAGGDEGGDGGADGGGDGGEDGGEDEGGDGDDNESNGAYKFQYSNPESSRMESSDVNGNIKGQYSYINNAGTHDLSYIAGPGVGFQPTGGSLAQPNNLKTELLVKTSQSSFPSHSFASPTTQMGTKMDPPQLKFQHFPSQTKSKSPSSYISDEEVTVEKFFLPGQHGKTGYVIRYNN